MIITMVVSLYTSRVILNALGVDDYGIYNVVGGIVGMFSILSGSLSASISRFITFELGKGDTKRLKTVFSTGVNIQLMLGVIVLLVAETIGLWFLNNKMVIPESRLLVSNWVYHLSLITFVVNLISIPYNAAIIAHEKMGIFAYISILEVVGKLLISYLVVISPIDKLVFYALLMTLLSIFIRFIYGRYCSKHFEECTYHFVFDKKLLRQMFGFAGWNFIGASSGILRDQGGSILINLFSGPAVNAARAIALQVNAAIYGFASNFMTALNPQITKSYASGDHDYLMKLLFQGSRLSFYLLLLISLPILINTDYILQLWLSVVPEHTVYFVQLALILGISESISNPLVTAMLATGNIRNYQILIGSLQILNFPLSYVFLKLGCAPEVVTIIAIIISQCCLTGRLYMLRGMIQLSARKFLKEVYANVIIVTIFSLLIPLLVNKYFGNSLIGFIIISMITLSTTLLSIYYVGCSKGEQAFVKDKVKKAMIKIKII